MNFPGLKTLAALAFFAAPLHAEPIVHSQRAAEVQAYVQKTFWNPKANLYIEKAGELNPAFVWDGGIAFSSLVAASRHDKSYKSLVRSYFKGLDGYWDAKVKIPGYEPSPTAGGGSDKYYDDNAWMVLTFIEAYELTNDSSYLKRSSETLDFVLSGWDDAAGGGIWWHEGKKDGSKNTCVNAPAAVGCLELAKFKNAKDAPKLIAEAKRLVEWTNKTFQEPNGLFGDRIIVETGKIHRGQLSYNTALMIRANLGLYNHTGEEPFLTEAKRLGKAADQLISKRTNAYRDHVKWSHLLVEADLELYRKTGEEYLLERAKRNADFHYQQFKTDPPKELITAASIARELWLLADMETETGREFWKKSDEYKK